MFKTFSISSLVDLEISLSLYTFIILFPSQCAEDSINTTLLYCIMLFHHSNQDFILFQETHIMHKFDDDFYGSMLKVCVTGYLREEKSFESLGKRT